MTTIPIKIVKEVTKFKHTKIFPSIKMTKGTIPDIKPTKANQKK